MTRRSRLPSADHTGVAADRELLRLRLRELGCTAPGGVEVHENRMVMASVSRRGVLRIHRGYAYAADRVLRAVVAFTDPATPASARRRAARAIAAFPAVQYVADRPRRGSPVPHDRPVLARLRRLHATLNARHFASRLCAVPIRLSGRMVTRLGEVTVDRRRRTVVEIAMARRHVLGDPWGEVTETLLHEMVHQWQVESGMEADHGASFRERARAVGIAPRARRSRTERRQHDDHGEGQA